MNFYLEDDNRFELKVYREFINSNQKLYALFYTDLLKKK